MMDHTLINQECLCVGINNEQGHRERGKRDQALILNGTDKM